MPKAYHNPTDMTQQSPSTYQRFERFEHYAESTGYNKATSQSHKMDCPTQRQSTQQFALTRDPKSRPWSTQEPTTAF